MNNADLLKEIRGMRNELYGKEDSLLQKKRTYADCEAIRRGLESSQFRVDIQGYRYECLFKHQEGENLYVIYDVANMGGFP